MKKQINTILTERFPKEKAICVLTRVDFDYIKKISTSMAWIQLWCKNQHLRNLATFSIHSQ